jgi:flagellar hook-basal body complex protein FliE
MEEEIETRIKEFEEELNTLETAVVLLKDPALLSIVSSIRMKISLLKLYLNEYKRIRDISFASEDPILAIDALSRFADNINSVLRDITNSISTLRKVIFEVHELGKAKIEQTETLTKEAKERIKYHRSRTMYYKNKAKVERFSVVQKAKKNLRDAMIRYAEAERKLELLQMRQELARDKFEFQKLMEKEKLEIQKKRLELMSKEEEKAEDLITKMLLGEEVEETDDSE